MRPWLHHQQDPPLGGRPPGDPVEGVDGGGTRHTQIRQVEQRLAPVASARTRCETRARAKSSELEASRVPRKVNNVTGSAPRPSKGQDFISRGDVWAPSSGVTDGMS